MSVASSFVGVGRFGLSALASLGMVIGQLAGAASPAQAEEFEDPWFEEAIHSGLGSINPSILPPNPGSTRPSNTPVPARSTPAVPFKPTDAPSSPAGQPVQIYHLDFRPGERIVEWTYRYVPDCPKNRCWERVYEDVYVMDAHGSMTFTWDTQGVAPGRYRFCTGGMDGCRSRYAELELTRARAPR
jgi:hypothetical protein